MVPEICFWLLAGCVAYVYVLYPLLMSLLARLRPRPVRRAEPSGASVSIIVAAYNEQATIARRAAELVDLVSASGVSGEVIIVSDGSTDRTAAEAQRCGRGTVRVVELPVNAGKAVALNAGCSLANGDILVFADTRQTWAPDALSRLLENFADPAVGAASGELILGEQGGVMGGVGLYWRYEKWLRRQESLFHSTVGATGAIAAVRRELYRPIPPGTILDDVYWPLRVVMQGYRVVHDPRARAFDHLPDSPQDEFRRKTRTLSSNFQLLMRLPESLVPWRNPIALQLISHKAARLAVPWALLGMLLLSAAIPGSLYRVLFWLQVSFYAMALTGIWSKAASHLRIVSAAASFVVLNAAAFVAFWIWITGRAGRSWKKVSYDLSSFQPGGVHQRAMR